MSLLAIGGSAQDRSPVRVLYDRTIQYIDNDDLMGLQAMSDSLAYIDPQKDPNTRSFAQVLFALVLRKSGRAADAFYALDSVQLDPEEGHVLVRYLYSVERARSLKALKLYPQAASDVEKAIQLTRAFNMPSEEARCLILSAEIHRNRGDYERAVTDLIAAEKLVEVTKDTKLLTLIDLTWGSVFYYQERYQEALDRYKRSYDRAARDGLTANLGNALFNMSSAVYYIDGPEASLRMLQEALTKHGSDPRFEADVRLNMANMYNELEAFAKARAELGRVVAIRRQLNDTSGIVECGLVLAKTLWNDGRRDSALSAIAEVITLSEHNGALEEQVEAEGQLAGYLRSLGRTADALTQYQHYDALKDSLNEIKKGETVNRLEIQFETEKKEQALKVKDLELAEANAAKHSKEVQSYWLMGAAVVLLLVLGLVLRNSQHLRKLRAQEQVLHERRVTDLLQQQEIRALDAMMQGQEKERERIAKDLHDRLGSMLSAIKLQFSALEARMSRMETEQKDQYRHVFSLLDEAVSEVRRISHDMMRGVITQFGLERALEDLRSSIEAPGTLQVELSTFGLEGRLEPKLEIAVYRMVQEMISNVLKHARADHITIQVTRSAAALNVIVEDNGRGFDLESATEGMGMGNIRARAAEFKGSVNVDTQAQRGTSISIDIPLA